MGLRIAKSNRLMESSKFEILIKFINSNECHVRVKMKYSNKTTEWHSWINKLEGQYIDIGIEPFLISSIDFLEINSYKEISKGKLQTPQIVDLSYEYELFLKENEIDFFLENGIIRI